jgi:hypothetical protein
MDNAEETLSPPIPEEVGGLSLPIFIPARQNGTIQLSLHSSGLPLRNMQETDDEYHERLRTVLENHHTYVRAFAIFDDTHRYWIDLARWLSQPNKK